MLYSFSGVSWPILRPETLAPQNDVLPSLSVLEQRCVEPLPVLTWEAELTSEAAPRSFLHGKVLTDSVYSSVLCCVLGTTMGLPAASPRGRSPGKPWLPRAPGTLTLSAQDVPRVSVQLCSLEAPSRPPAGQSAGPPALCPLPWAIRALTPAP